MTPSDLEAAEAWLGREEHRVDVLDPWPAAALTAALGRNDPPGRGEPLPPFWHQLYHLPVVHADATGPDGHARKGGFLPPVPLPRRMWAGGRLRIERPLLVGQEIAKVSAVKAITPKTGRQGPLVFVLVEHRLTGPQGLAVIEEHDIVYREPPVRGAAGPPPAPAGAVWQRQWRPDEVLLFRYSALTYNGHRIHYDRPYATEVEGYPGLVVHGPLIATLLLDLLRRERPEASLCHFAYRAQAPLFAGEALTVHGKPAADGAEVRLWATGNDGRLAMEARATLAGALSEETPHLPGG
ncbi:FAS1-like dehydratase domain-containing protein [Benzoatithermus flavus]|uniref:MaoC family dehydratase N-terminal domain-containing protein n=1 Tax=Benzoatithermus flavus TaxID=3108223 RepID=A0ABU8XWJ8_9PROT